MFSKHKFRAEAGSYGRCFLNWKRLQTLTVSLFITFCISLGSTIYAYVNASLNLYGDMTRGWLALHHASLSICIVSGILTFVSTMALLFWYGDTSDDIEMGRQKYYQWKNANKRLPKAERKRRREDEAEVRHRAYIRSLEKELNLEPVDFIYADKEK